LRTRADHYRPRPTTSASTGTRQHAPADVAVLDEKTGTELANLLVALAERIQVVIVSHDRRVLGRCAPGGARRAGGRWGRAGGEGHGARADAWRGRGRWRRCSTEARGARGGLLSGSTRARRHGRGHARATSCRPRRSLESPDTSSLGEAHATTL